MPGNVSRSTSDRLSDWQTFLFETNIDWPKFLQRAICMRVTFFVAHGYFRAIPPHTHREHVTPGLRTISFYVVSCHGDSGPQ